MISPSTMPSSIIYFLLLISAITPTHSARVLDQLVGPQPSLDQLAGAQPPFDAIAPPEAPGFPTEALQPPVVPLPPAPIADVPEAQPTPADTPQLPEADIMPPVVAPDAPLPAVPSDIPQSPEADVPSDTPVMGPTAPLPAVPAAQATSEKPTLSFFMHDVLGGSQASGRVVTGIVATSGSSNIPFSKANNQVFPISGGVPLFNGQVNNLVNNNNAPFLASMNQQQQQQQQQNVFQNAGNGNSVINGGNSQPFVTAGQLPQGASLQELMFGSITVIDDQITEGHELGSGVIGSAQGFYLASSLDGESHTMAWTVILHGGHESEGEVSTISFFGVHRPAAPLSYVAVIGGTGIYENAKGYATLEALPQVDQHTTDGVETIVNVSVYVT